MLYATVAVLTMAVLAYGVVEQIYDTNFYVLWETTALLAGDHPYRDFYQWGSPLLTAVSTASQWLSGRRLLGEFLVHWIFITTGMVMGFHLAVTMSRSIPASMATTLVAIFILVSAPTFQFPKIFFYPVAVCVAWWYMERPTTRRAAAVGLVTAIAFLYRHDHGVYIGLASVLAFVLARLANPASRHAGAAVREAAVYTAVTAALIVPWAIVVEMNEGLVDYVRMRAEWNRTWAPDRVPYLALLNVNPLWWLRNGRESERLLAQDAATHWLLQVTLLLPLLALGSAAVTMLRQWRNRQPVSMDTCRVVLAAGLAAIVAGFLFREDGYFVVVLPLTVAFGARLLAPGAALTVHRLATAGVAVRAWRASRAAIASVMFAITVVAAVGYVEWDLFAAGELEEIGPTYRKLLASPAIDGYAPAAAALETTRDRWADADDDERTAVLIRYMHDCTADGDRVLATGSTPYQVGYYVERPVAGGHVQWHHGWRSDPAHEHQLLRLIEGQSMPFAFSTHDPLLADLAKYPRIHAYLMQHYAEIEGSGGRLLVDTRRHPTGSFGALGFPCFR